MTDAPWEQLPDLSYRSTHNPAFVLSEAAFRTWTLTNEATGETWPIAGESGLYSALDVAESIILGGVDGTHERNILRADDKPKETR